MTRLRACATIYAMPNMEDTKKFQQWLAIAQSGDAGAMFDVADAYFYGNGVEKNPQQFFAWTKKSADAGLPEAMLNLAIAYKDGVGVEEDMSQFSAWTKKAADAGLPEAMFNLAFAYKNGWGVEEDMSQLFAWMEKAADADFPKAMLALAFAYQDGLGVKKNPKQFFHWVEKAYQRGVVDAAIMVPFLRLLQNREIDEPTYDQIVVALFVLRDECKSILQKKHSVNKGQPLSHYTKFAALDSVLEGGESNHLRLYNVAYFNDPLEGAAFPSTLGDKMCEFIYGCRNKIPHEITVEGKKFSVYACAFSARDDHLPLWIAYGNNGDGYNITGTIPRHMKADKEAGAMQEMHRSFFIKDKGTATNSDDARIRVYKVLYGDAAKDTVQKLTPHLQTLQSILQGKDDKVIQTAKAVAEWILADLRYLYKDEAFEWEQEYRIIRVVDDKTTECDRSHIPPRLFIKTPPVLFLENGCKITVGPCVAENAAELYIRRQLTKNGWHKTTDIAHSQMPYR